MLEHSTRPTIGFISTWSVYQGATIGSYMYTLLQGISVAAREHGCNLLLGCGISLASSPLASHTALSLAEPNVDLFQWVRGTRRGGIRQAMQHLFQHGHRRIAFIAGKSGHGGDVAERLAAYREILGEAGIAYDSRLVAYGEHRLRDGRIAMQTILETGAEFTALLASNDLSCIGALQALHAAFAHRRFERNGVEAERVRVVEHRAARFIANRSARFAANSYERAASRTFD